MMDAASANLEIDLNLLKVLDAVLASGSATRAARRLHVTQSAVSSALRRLREALDDPLFVRTSRGLVPTPRAAAMADDLRAWLDDGRMLVHGGPSARRRTFIIASPDAMIATIVPTLLPLFIPRFPSAELRFITPERMLTLGGLAGGGADLLVGAPPALPAGCRGEPLYEDHMICLLRRGHPAAKKLTLDAYASLPHCEFALFGTPHNAVDRALAHHGKSRTIAVAVPSFSSIPSVVAHSDCVATLPARAARAFAGDNLVHRQPPIEIAVEKPIVAWHNRVEGDAAITAVRALIIEAAALAGTASKRRSTSRANHK